MKKQSNEVTEMKKSFTACIVMLFLLTNLSFALTGQEVKKPKRFFTVFSYNVLMPADANFKEVYDSAGFYPNIKAGLRLSQKFYLWTGYGFFSMDGEIDVYGIKMEAKSKQAFVSYGAGYRGNMTKKIAYRIEAGAVSFKYEEETMGKKISESSYGFKVDCGICYDFNRFLFSEIFAGYMYGSKEIEERPVKIGGAMAGIGLGVRF